MGITGTALITNNRVEEKLGALETYDRVKALDAGKGIVWLDASAANNTYALAIRSADAAEKGIATLSDLAAQVNADTGLTLASNAEWYARPDGLRPLQAHYGFAFDRAEVSRMGSGLVYMALRNADGDVGLVFATDGRSPAFDFVVLQDDAACFPAYALTPTVRAETLEAHPEIAGHLNALSAVLDDATMAGLDVRVNVERMSIENVA